MNLRCSYCSTPFALGMVEKVAALRLMHEQNLHHYDAYCPRCRRANPVSRQRLEMFTPGWQTAINAPQPTLPGFTSAPPRPVGAVPAAPKARTAPARRKHAPATKKKTGAKKPAATAKPAAKRKPAAKKAAKKAAVKKKRK